MRSSLKQLTSPVMSKEGLWECAGTHSLASWQRRVCVCVAFNYPWFSQQDRWSCAFNYQNFLTNWTKKKETTKTFEDTLKTKKNKLKHLSKSQPDLLGCHSEHRCTEIQPLDAGPAGIPRGRRFCLSTWSAYRSPISATSLILETMPTALEICLF